MVKRVYLGARGLFSVDISSYHAYVYRKQSLIE
jgi:hypothetical protein